MQVYGNDPAIAERRERKWQERRTQWSRSLERIAAETSYPPLRALVTDGLALEAGEVLGVQAVADVEELLRTLSDKEARKGIYSALRWLGRYTEDAGVAGILVACLALESDRRALESLLLYLREQKVIMNCSAVIRLAQDRRADVRRGALQALARCHPPCPEAEAVLIEVLETSDDRFALICASVSLQQLGTERAVEALSKLIHHRSGDLKSVVIRALSRIGGSSLLLVYVDALSDRHWLAKRAAMEALHDHGDESVVEPVLARTKQIMQRKRKRSVSPAETSEIVLALGFLDRFRDGDARIQRLFAGVKEKWDNLFPHEQQWLVENVPFFGAMSR